MTAMFANRGVLVTDGASGIGLAVARLLYGHGARLALWDRDADGLMAAADKFNAVSVEVDITQPDAVRAAMERTAEALGEVYAVVHSAGILRTGLFETLDIDAQRQMIEVNLIGTIQIAHAAIPHLRKTGGSLILLGSVSSFYGSPEFATYGATKAALLNWAEALRIELASSGVHVGVVLPLFVNSPMLRGNRGARLVNSRSPLVRIYTPDQVARALVRGMERRHFMIFPGTRPRLIYAISRYGAFIAHRLMASSWRR